MSTISIQPSDLALTDSGETVLVVDIKTAREVYSGFYDTDDEDGHIWIGGDEYIPHSALMAQICSHRGLRWIPFSDLAPTAG